MDRVVYADARIESATQGNACFGIFLLLYT